MDIKYYILNNSNEELFPLKNMLTNFFSFFYCVDTFGKSLNDNNIEEIFNAKPDVVFIDDSFFETYGFSILELFSKNNILVIVVTSNFKTTIQMFKKNVFFCIKKPLTIENLSLAVCKLLSIIIKKSILKK